MFLGHKSAETVNGMCNLNFAQKLNFKRSDSAVEGYVCSYSQIRTASDW